MVFLPLPIYAFTFTPLPLSTPLPLDTLVPTLMTTTYTINLNSTLPKPEAPYLPSPNFVAYAALPNPYSNSASTNNRYSLFYSTIAFSGPLIFPVLFNPISPATTLWNLNVFIDRPYGRS